MSNETVGSLKISGSGSAGGGVYDEVKISGSGKITGNVECNEFHISGSGKVEGNVKAKEYKTSGSSRIDGSLEAEDIKISGSSHIAGDIKCQEIKVSGSAHIERSLNGGEVNVSGSTRIDGNLRGEQVRVSGSIDIKGDCESEEFFARGSFQIGGLLNAGNIEVGVSGFCCAKEIGGEKIEIRELGGTGIWNKIVSLFTGHTPGLKTDIIEGDDIYLEYTTAKIVRGNNITIGRGCVIDTVEYKEKLDITDSGKAVSQVKIS
jgi:cytoskeletal protein CcmA (bactofilin family)